MSWINVNDKLPNECGYYIVFNGIKVRQAYFEEGSKSWFFAFKATDITHWQPLPEPPEE